jgi:excisionase family DNA binding protein
MKGLQSIDWRVTMKAQRMSITEASRMAACSPSTVRRWLKSGTLEGVKTDGTWEIERETLMLHLSQLSKPFKGRQGASRRVEHEDPIHHEALNRQLMEDLQRERKINDELRAENRKLQEEVKALLVGKSGVMGWVRSVLK